MLRRFITWVLRYAAHIYCRAGMTTQVICKHMALFIPNKHNKKVFIKSKNPWKPRK